MRQIHQDMHILYGIGLSGMSYFPAFRFWSWKWSKRGKIWARYLRDDEDESVYKLWAVPGIKYAASPSFETFDHHTSSVGYIYVPPWSLLKYSARCKRILCTTLQGLPSHNSLFWAPFLSGKTIHFIHNDFMGFPLHSNHVWRSASYRDASFCSKRNPEWLVRPPLGPKCKRSAGPWLQCSSAVPQLQAVTLSDATGEMPRWKPSMVPIKKSFHK